MATIITEQRPALSLATLNHEYIAIMSDKKPKDKDNDPAFFKGEFSFVNKDAKNIESKDHNSAVSWHVMNRYERWKKQEQAKKLRASANVPIGPLSSSGGEGSASGRGQPSRSRSRGSHSRPAMSPNAASVNPWGLNPWQSETALPPGFSEQGRIPVSTGGAFLPSMATSPSTHSSPQEDPFSLLNASPNIDVSAMMETDEHQDPDQQPITNKLVAFAYDSFIPNLWPTEPGNVQTAHEISQSWDDAAAMTRDSCFANAYCSLLAGAMAKSGTDQSLLVEVELFKSQAMAELRQRVARRTGSQDLLTLKAILKLFSAETINDSTAVARVHLKMLRNLVAASGGIILLDSWFREDLLSCDCYFALKYGTRPLLPAAEWTPGPLSQPWKARFVSAGIFGDHAAGIDAVVEHPMLKAVLADLRELFKTQEYVLAHEVPAADQLLRWRQLRRFDCISRLADHYTNLTIYPHLFDFPKTQALTTVIMALLANLVLGCPEPVRLGKRMLDELRQKITEAESEIKENGAGRLLFWALYIGSLAERVHPQTSPARDEFASRLRECEGELGLKTWEDRKKLLRQLLFSVRLHEEIENGRPFRTVDCTQGLYVACGTSWREPLVLQPESEASMSK